MPQDVKPAPKKENMLLNLLLNIAIPTIILMKLSGPEHLGPKLGVVVALAFPIGYGVMDYFREHKVNFFSALGVVSILLTGGIALFELDPKYIAIKEAAIPGAFAIATLISIMTPYPLVKAFLYNDKVMQIKRVDKALAEHNSEQAFQKSLVVASFIIAGSFVMSSILNYILAKWILVSPPGTEEFNAELGRMTALSYPIIAVPSLIVLLLTMYFVYKRITGLTGLKFEEIFNVAEEDDTKSPSSTSN